MGSRLATISLDYKQAKTHPRAGTKKPVRSGNVGRNSVPGPRLVDVDFSVFKKFLIRRISEAFNVQLRAEMFNIFNHSNFAPPIVNAAVLSPVSNAVGTVIGASGIPNGCAIDRTTATSRQIQFGLNVIW